MSQTPTTSQTPSRASSLASGDGSRRSRASHLTKRVGKYYVGRTIGEGTFAKVKYAQHMDTGQTVAIKVLDKEHLILTGMVEQIKREIAILKQVRHPNVVQLVEVMSSKDKIFMVMELVTGGDLFDKVAAEGPMKEPAAKEVFAQLLGALGHCHACGVVHRDLKPENVLLSAAGEVKLSDFGLGSVREVNTVRDDGLLNTTCGTPNYVAPEVLAKRGYDGVAADVWSLGVVLYVILAGCLPFDEEDLVELFHKISAAEYEVPPWLSAEAAGILGQMLQPDAEKRATLEQLWAHPWMAGVAGGLRRQSMSQSELPPADQLVPPAEEAEEQAQRPGGVQRAPSSAEDLFKENVEPSALTPGRRPGRGGGGSGESMSPSPSRRLNAFQLINAYLDISPIFEARDDVVTRRTRFTSTAPPATLLAAIESAAVAVGGRVERRTEERMRVHIPNRKGSVHVTAQVFEVLPGKWIVDVAKTKGNTVEFYIWYGELVMALGDLVSHRANPIVSRPPPESRALTQRRLNAFELIGTGFSLGALFEEEDEALARHVQFSSRAPPADILRAIGDGVRSMGGRVEREGEKTATLMARLPGGRSMRLSVRMFELLPGVRVVQIAKESGSMMDLYKFYNKLAAQHLGDVLMRRKDGRAAHPRATTAGSLVSASTLGSASDLARMASLGALSSSSIAAGSASAVSTSLGGSLNRGSPELPPVIEATPSVEAGAAALAAR